MSTRRAPARQGKDMDVGFRDVGSMRGCGAAARSAANPCSAPGLPAPSTTAFCQEARSADCDVVFADPKNRMVPNYAHEGRGPGSAPLAVVYTSSRLVEMRCPPAPYPTDPSRSHPHSKVADLNTVSSTDPSFFFSPGANVLGRLGGVLLARRDNLSPRLGSGLGRRNCVPPQRLGGEITNVSDCPRQTSWREEEEKENRKNGKKSQNSCDEGINKSFQT